MQHTPRHSLHQRLRRVASSRMRRIWAPYAISSLPWAVYATTMSTNASSALSTGHFSAGRSAFAPTPYLAAAVTMSCTHPGLKASSIASARSLSRRLALVPRLVRGAVAVGDRGGFCVTCGCDVPSRASVPPSCPWSGSDLLTGGRTTMHSSSMAQSWIVRYIRLCIASDPALMLATGVCGAVRPAFLCTSSRCQSSGAFHLFIIRQRACSSSLGKKAAAAFLSWLSKAAGQMCRAKIAMMATRDFPSRTSVGHFFAAIARDLLRWEEICPRPSATASPSASSLLRRRMSRTACRACDPCAKASLLYSTSAVPSAPGTTLTWYLTCLHSPSTRAVLALSRARNAARTRRSVSSARRRRVPVSARVAVLSSSSISIGLPPALLPSACSWPALGLAAASSLPARMLGSHGATITPIRGSRETRSPGSLCSASSPAMKNESLSTCSPGSHFAAASTVASRRILRPCFECSMPTTVSGCVGSRTRAGLGSSASLLPPCGSRTGTSIATSMGGPAVIDSRSVCLNGTHVVMSASPPISYEFFVCCGVIPLPA